MGKSFERYRDPVHNFIEIRPLEKKIVDSYPFQRLRNIKQLAMTHLVFHGAEHTRFGHSLGVTHLVSKAFNSAISNGDLILAPEKQDWFEQILRLIALTHDLGHAPFSHAAEAVFPTGIKHEQLTEKIIKETEIAGLISEIGEAYKDKYGDKYDITADLICDIYAGRLPGENNEFTFLKSFMDSELDCDKMDYLLRDSLFCGVNYGKYDVERLIACLRVYMQDGETPRLAIDIGGVQAFEEFVLARYFMFVQVYFHRTRRYFDYMYAIALTRALDGGTFPDNTEEYLLWDDCRVIQLMKEKSSEIEECSNIINRIVYPQVLYTKTHPEHGDNAVYKLTKKQLYESFGKENFIEDNSAEKMPHKMPVKMELTDEKAIVIVDPSLERYTTISDESEIIKCLYNKIAIKRVYAKPELCSAAKEIVKENNIIIQE